MPPGKSRAVFIFSLHLAKRKRITNTEGLNRKKKMAQPEGEPEYYDSAAAYCDPESAAVEAQELAQRRFRVIQGGLADTVLPEAPAHIRTVEHEEPLRFAAPARRWQSYGAVPELPLADGQREEIRQIYGGLLAYLPQGTLDNLAAGASLAVHNRRLDGEYEPGSKMSLTISRLILPRYRLY